MSLVELLGRADERGLAASAVACIDRCLALLDDGEAADPALLRPLWAGADSGADWGTLVAAARAAVADGTSAATAATAASAGDDATADDELTRLLADMAVRAPSAYSEAELRAWAGACSDAALEIHRRLDGGAEGVSPLTAGELRRQTQILEALAEGRGAGLRKALDLSTEGRRVLRAAVSRRARAQR
ncbi:hypothetical protein NLX86_12650 [Streptomyces sp. A3M-1-3]|uniref:hypothetical protein n=1 Tax=Streptomyces sp. A3M-1-3 TaxID=2962044 RepID=UPI0020B8C21A|nr:hypothetical protein [Streptomyces sp. A3M-1-3]MCP3818930.1 hypothetical protein [Streptomyces sp. A3M-1-3]